MMGIIHILLEVRNVVLIKLKMERISMLKKTTRAVPDGARINSKKKSLIFLNKIKHLAFRYQHFKWNVVIFVFKFIKNKL